MADWVILKNTLCISSNGNVYYPLAKDLYPLLTKEKSKIQFKNIELSDPRDAFPSLKYSSIGSPFKISIESKDKSIWLNAYSRKKVINIPIVIHEGKIIDHFVFENKWFYISNDTSEIEDALRESSISSAGEISLAQYLKLKNFEIMRKESLFEDSVDASLMQQHPIEDIDVSALPLRATLYDYQKNGFLWIRSILGNINGCILGDEMGLGKTLQIITYAVSMQQKGACSILVVAPISLLANWEKECRKFAPSLNILIHHGSQRASNFKDFSPYDIVVTSYSVVINDLYMLNMKKWDLVVLDEAQNIKNPTSARTIACKSLKRKNAIAVSGTPFENHVTDVWSIVDFIKPGLLGSLEQFNDVISDNVDGGQKLEPILSSLMIRRLVKDVANELPPRIDIDQPLQMTSKECEEYAQYLDEIKGSSQTDRISIGMFQKLRMYCTHPMITNNDVAIDPFSKSVKYQRLCEILEGILENREKVIVFTSYKKMFEIFEDDLRSRYGVKIWMINGETDVDDRQIIVDQFNQYSSSAVLILNPRAAGTGLNITGANHVIHYNLEWNPALEDQSSARAYRKGQTKTVFVYRLYYKDTIEQVMQQRILRKRDIAKEAVVGVAGDSLDEEDLLKALTMIPKF
jgi:SNF2 family DNA or RNA helicase